MLFVLASLGNRLFQKLQTVPMYNYPITVNLVSSVMYVPLCFAYILPALWCVTPSPISEEERAIPKYKFAIMGALDCVSSVMQTLAVNFVPNPSTIVLLQQSAIPISMVISRVSFKGVRNQMHESVQWLSRDEMREVLRLLASRGSSSRRTASAASHLLAPREMAARSPAMLWSLAHEFYGDIAGGVDALQVELATQASQA